MKSSELALHHEYLSLSSAERHIQACSVGCVYASLPFQVGRFTWAHKKVSHQGVWAWLLKQISYIFCVPQHWHTSKLLSVGHRKSGTMFSLFLLFVSDFLGPCTWMTLIFVHLQFYWLGNHSPCCFPDANRNYIND